MKPVNKVTFEEKWFVYWLRLYKYCKNIKAGEVEIAVEA